MYRQFEDINIVTEFPCLLFQLGDSESAKQRMLYIGELYIGELRLSDLRFNRYITLINRSVDQLALFIRSTVEFKLN